MMYAVRSAITATAELLVIYGSLSQIWTVEGRQINGPESV